MIGLDHVSKSYKVLGSPIRTVLNDVSIEFPKCNLAILGSNGAGKSTLLRMIAGIEDPDEGVIHRSGTISWPIGFRGSFHRELSALENIKFVARIYGQDTREVTSFVRQFAEIGPFFDKPVKTYSSGMVARIAFGVSMAINFDVYLIDELLAVGDARFREKCKRVFNDRLARSQIIMVSHSMSTLRDYCNAAVLLHHGTLTVFNDVEEAIERYLAINQRPTRF